MHARRSVHACNQWDFCLHERIETMLTVEFAKAGSASLQ
jgi:hypothetical protein